MPSEPTTEKAGEVESCAMIEADAEDKVAAALELAAAGGAWIAGVVGAERGGE